MFNSPAVGWGGQICARSLLTTRNMSKSASPQAPPRRDNSARCWCLLLLLLEAMWLLVVSRRSPGNYCRFSFNERDAGWLSPRISKRLTPHNQILHMKDGGRGASAWFFPARGGGGKGGAAAILTDTSKSLKAAGFVVEMTLHHMWRSRRSVSG